MFVSDIVFSIAAVLLTMVCTRCCLCDSLTAPTDVSAPAAAASSTAAATNGSAVKKGSGKKVSTDVVSTAVQRAGQTAVDVCTREVLAELGGGGDQSQLAARVHAVLTRLQNAAYTQGFFAAQAPVRKHMFGQ